MFFVFLVPPWGLPLYPFTPNDPKNGKYIAIPFICHPEHPDTGPINNRPCRNLPCRCSLLSILLAANLDNIHNYKYNRFNVVLKPNKKQFSFLQSK